MSGYFTPASFKFLKDLKRNNNREWFEKNKPRYEAQIKQPCLNFITDLAAPLQKISREYVASPRPVGGSLFRIYRDARFSSDKSPYKTHAGMSFFHGVAKATARASAGNGMIGRLDAPVFYLHLEPGSCFIGGGIWHPQADTLKRVRNYMVANPASWKKASRSPAFRKNFTLGGGALSRPPQGYDPAHELIEDLKRKDFVCSAPLSDAQVCAPDFLKNVVRHFSTAAPLMDWLCGALDLDF